MVRRRLDLQYERLPGHPSGLFRLADWRNGRMVPGSWGGQMLCVRGRAICLWWL